MYRYLVDIENEQTGEMVSWLGGAETPASALLEALSTHAVILFDPVTKNWPPNLNVKIRRDATAGRA